MVHINGEEVAADNLTLKNYLESNGYSLDRIAVEINEAIVPKAKYQEIVLKTNDIVEIVNFVAGG